MIMRKGTNAHNKDTRRRRSWLKRTSQVSLLASARVHSVQRVLYGTKDIIVVSSEEGVKLLNIIEAHIQKLLELRSVGYGSRDGGGGGDHWSHRRDHGVKRSQLHGRDDGGGESGLNLHGRGRRDRGLNASVLSSDRSGSVSALIVRGRNSLASFFLVHRRAGDDDVSPYTLTETSTIGSTQSPIAHVASCTSRGLHINCEVNFLSRISGGNSNSINGRQIVSTNEGETSVLGPRGRTFVSQSPYLDELLLRSHDQTVFDGNIGNEASQIAEGVRWRGRYVLRRTVALGECTSSTLRGNS